MSFRTRSLRSITLSLSIAFIAVVPAAAQRVAAIAPDRDQASSDYAALLAGKLADAGLRVADGDAADAAFRAAEIQSPFNMDAGTARRAGTAIGVDTYILVRSRVERRNSLARGSYFEASAAIFAASARTGRLQAFRLEMAESATERDAAEKLAAGAALAGNELKSSIERAYRSELEAERRSPLPEVPLEGTPEARGLRTPIPYLRIRPKYTEQAFLFGIRATVDAEVSIAEDGTVTAVDIVRWAGYGLDESVRDAINAMNWRPAERDGKKLPMRILLRYNFTKIEKEEQ